MKKALLLLSSFIWLLAQQTADDLVQAATMRHEKLIKDGYNLTYGFSFQNPSERGPLRAEFLVPDAREAHHVSLWLKTLGGDASVRLKGDDGAEIFAWAGQEGELSLVRRLPVGKYTLEITASGITGGRSEFAVKGPLLPVCKLDHACQEVAAQPSQGFHWPYLLYIPPELKSHHLLVMPNNTGFAVEKLDLIRASGFCEVKRHCALADRLGCQLLIPLFPRPILDPNDPDGDNLYLHALSRDALVTQQMTWKRVDLQLLSMIEHVRSSFANRWPIQPKVLLSGFSASGMFANRFALLHPERVVAVACGSPGGWPMVPIKTFSGAALPFPVGCADLATLVGRPLDQRALRGVAWFFYLGDQDRNDAVVYRDSFSKSDEALIMRQFGTTLQDRWGKAEKAYLSENIPATFRLYPHVAHAVSEAMAEDIALFFEAQLKKAGDRNQKQGHGSANTP